MSLEIIVSCFGREGDARASYFITTTVHTQSHGSKIYNAHSFQLMDSVKCKPAKRIPNQTPSHPRGYLKSDKAIQGQTPK